MHASLRLFCKNPRCRQRLPEPVANERRAFCCRGCHHSYYISRCIVCDEPRRKNHRFAVLFCSSKTCRSKYIHEPDFYEFTGPLEGDSWTVPAFLRRRS
jgi:hypothetical protein